MLRASERLSGSLLLFVRLCSLSSAKAREASEKGQSEKPGL